MDFLQLLCDDEDGDDNNNNGKCRRRWSLLLLQVSSSAAAGATAPDLSGAECVNCLCDRPTRRETLFGVETFPGTIII